MKAVTVTHDLKIGWIELEKPLHRSAGAYVGGWIKELVLQVYGIDLNNWPDYLAPKAVAEMKGLEEY